MDWIIILLIAAGAAAGGFIVYKRRAPKKSMVPSRVVQKLVKLDPTSVSVETIATNVQTDTTAAHGSRGGVDRTSVGSASLLRSNRKIYRDKKYFYMTTPDKLKSSGQADFKAEGETVRLSFVRRGVPHSVSCRTAGRTKLTPELTELMDAPVKVAYKLYPVGRITKEEKRSFLRYLVNSTDDNAADSAGETTSYVSFDVFLRRSDKRARKSTNTVITDLRVANFKNSGRSHFNVHTVINQFRAYMLIKPFDQRKVQVEKLADRETLVGKIRTQLHQPAPSWTVELLDLEDDVSLDTFCIEQPGCGERRSGHRTALNPEDRVRIFFQRNGKRYEMEGEVDQIGAQYAAIRPVGPLTEETGLEVSVIDFSAGGALLQGSRKMLEFVLNKRIKAREMSSEHPAHEDLLRRFKRQLIHFTFYPKLQFPNVAKRFHPRIPEKICLLGRVIRSEFVRRRGKEVLQYGIQFVHDAHYDAEAEGSTAWQPIRAGHGERHFNEIHAKLGRLSGFLESQNRDGGSTSGLTQEVRDDRVALVVNKGASTVEQRRKRANS